MFFNKLKQALTKPENLGIRLEFRIVDAGFLAICIIFMPYLISIEKPDSLQTSSLVLFSVAIPFLAFHIFITQTMEKPKLPISAYLAKSYGATFFIGSVCTYFGIVTALAHSSLTVAEVFAFSCMVVVWLAVYIYKDTDKAVIRDINKMELELQKLESELRNPELEQDMAMKALIINPLLRHTPIKIEKK